MSVTLKILNAKTEVASYRIIDGETLTIHAQNNLNYQLIDDATGFAPQNIVAKRVGDDLHILLQDGDQIEDIIIEEYYDDPAATNMIVGQHENGNIYAYVPESGQTSDAVSMLAEQMAAPQALGGDEISALWVFSPWWLLAAGAVIGGVALAVGSGGDDSGSNKQPQDITPPTIPTTEISQDGTTVSGKTEPNATVTVKDKDGKVIGTAIADTNGDYSVTIPVQPEGDKLSVNATDKAGNASNAADVTAPDVTAPTAPTVSAEDNGDVSITPAADDTKSVEVKFSDKDGTEQTVTA
ncbi:Ig-like domain-containing protein, partial [Chelonobacter oris]|uniref:Ig-like domain-containing protein n=1 Tax=Chelonobacter oris TaxID=505317 RepID=UPI00244689B7